MNHEQPQLPLDERFKDEEQLTLDLPDDDPEPPRREPIRICIGNCKICRYCND